MKSTLVLAGFTFLAALADCTCNTKDTGNTGKEEDTSPLPACTVREWQLVAAGYMASCGLHTDGCIECWGNEFDEDDSDILDLGDADPPEGTFKYVAMSAIRAVSDYVYTKHACAISEDDSAVCWGYDAGGRTTPVPGSYELLSLGYFESCGLTVDGDINCWPGWIEQDPSQKYASFEVGYAFLCAVTTTGSLACHAAESVWHNIWDDYPPPEGNNYTQVTASSSGACAIDTDGLVSCWGSYDMPIRSSTVIQNLSAWRIGPDLGTGLDLRRWQDAPGGEPSRLPSRRRTGSCTPGGLRHG